MTTDFIISTNETSSRTVMVDVYYLTKLVVMQPPGPVPFIKVGKLTKTQT